MEWTNNKNQRCKFFLNHNSNQKTSHYVLSINGMYFETNRFSRDHLIEDEELERFNTININNMHEHEEFLKDLSNKVLYYKSVKKADDPHKKPIKRRIIL